MAAASFISDTQKLDKILLYLTYFPPIALLLMIIIISLLLIMRENLKIAGESKSNIVSKLFQGKKH